MSNKPAAAAKPAAETETPAIEPTFAPLLRDRWRARESGVLWNEHEVACEAGTPIEHLSRPQFWANIAQRLKPGDNIIAMPDCMSWRAELTVWDVGQGWAFVAPRGALASRPDFSDLPGLASEEFEVSYAGPIKKHRVVRKSDKVEVKSGLATPEEARRWVADHVKALKS